MSASVSSAALVGVEAREVCVEVDVSGGLPSVTIVGLGDAAVREARVRVQSALQNSDLPFPLGRISVNLAPADLRKDGTGFDLPLALGILLACGALPAAACDRTWALGELSLHGDVRPVRGALAVAEAARKAGARQLLVSAACAGEAALISGLEVRAVTSLADAVAYLGRGLDAAAPRICVPSVPATSAAHAPDLADVRGQALARRALEVAAAGGHHLLLVGGPGCGKTMLARRLPGILPPLDEYAALEITRIHSAAGLHAAGPQVRGLCGLRPFRAPHHSTTPAGLVGGGHGMPRPGELSLAHQGVLFLDELPEFQRGALEVLRQPLESREVILARAWGSIRFPADAQLVCAMNPCPCGHWGDLRRRCRCLSAEVSRYRARVSGPLLDRLDLHVHVSALDWPELEDMRPGECSREVQARVVAARRRQRERLGPGRTNAGLTSAEMRSHALPDAAGRELLRRASERLALSARAYERVLRVARTIADLGGAESVRLPDVREALQYREGGSAFAAPPQVATPPSAGEGPAPEWLPF